MRVRVSAYTSGTVTANARLSAFQAVGLASQPSAPNPMPITVNSINSTLTDRSGLATSASAQISPANVNRKYIFIQNISTGTIWINFTTAATAASPSMRLMAGDIFLMEDRFIAADAINVIREGGTDLAFVCKEA